MADDPQDVCDISPVSSPRFAGFTNDDTTTYFLFIEHTIVFSITTSFTRALMLWFASHYVFNLEYCSHVKSVSLFFQEFVFCLPATSYLKPQKTATYLTITTDIQKYLP